MTRIDSPLGHIARWQAFVAAFFLAGLVNLVVLTLIDSLVSDRHFMKTSVRDLPPINFIRIKPKPVELVEKPPTLPELPQVVQPQGTTATENQVKAQPRAKNPAPASALPPKPKWTTKPVPGSSTLERNRNPPKPSSPALVKKPVSREEPPSVLTPRVEIPTHGTGVKLPSLSGNTRRVDGPPGLWGDAERRTAGGRTGGPLERGGIGAGTGTGQGGGERNSGVQVLSRTLPAYPGMARNRQIEGWVMVEITVDRNGGVRNPRVVQASPPGVFDQAAVEAIQRWRFKPALREGAPVEQRVRQKVNFHLDRH